MLCYVDDCLVFTNTDSVDDHIDDICKVFDELDENGINLKASKLPLGRKVMPFLGIVITEEGITPNPEKFKAVKELQPPQTLKQLRSTLAIFASTKSLSQTSVRLQHHFMSKQRSMFRIRVTRQERLN